MGWLLTVNSVSSETPDLIAHLVPCGHNLHNDCLKPWVERANSCPICRAVFNEVQCRQSISGSTVYSYPVVDKQQAVVDDDPYQGANDFDDWGDDAFDEPEPCSICGFVDADAEQMYCDGCLGAVHVYCAGFIDSPEMWHCTSCQSSTTRGTRSRPRRIIRMRREQGARVPNAAVSQGGRRQGAAWARVWQTVWDRLNLDLDFPFDEHDTAATPRTQAQMTELSAWQRRFHVASQQGAADRFRESAGNLLDRHPESQEEVSAWNAFDKARQVHSDDEPSTTSSRRKRKTTASPASPGQAQNADAGPARQFKRPRTKRESATTGNARATASAVHDTNQQAERPSFLNSLLQEVERQPMPARDKASLAHGQLSPPLSSPTPAIRDASCPSSTPPPGASHSQPSSASQSPVIQPVSPALTVHSAYSAADPSVIVSDQHAPIRAHNSQRRRPHKTLHSSPSHGNLSYSTKAEIQRMVKATLTPMYRQQAVTKDEYTSINRDVSRMLYTKIGDARALSLQSERDKWQALADAEVAKAVEKLTRPASR